MTEVRWADGDGGTVCAAVLATVPEWFGLPDANADYIRTADAQPTLIADLDGEAVGLLTVVRHSPQTAEVHLLAVRRDLHRRGIGRALLARLEDHLRADGVRFLQVKTLSASDPDEGYAKTRRFYEASGFVIFEEMPDLWDASNPAVVMVKYLQTTIVGCACLVVEDGAVLLVREGKAIARNRFALPAGKPEIGETLTAAGIREAKEESGLDVALDGIVGFYQFPTTSEGVGVTNVVFAAHRIGGAISTSEAHPEVRFVGPDELAGRAAKRMLRGTHVVKAVADLAAGPLLPLETIQVMPPSPFPDKDGDHG